MRREFVLELDERDYADVLRIMSFIETEAEIEGRKAEGGGPLTNGSLVAEALRRYEAAVIDGRVPTEARIGKLAPGQPGRGVA